MRANSVPAQSHSSSEEGARTNETLCFSLHDVVKLAGLSRAIVLRLVKAGIVVPEKIAARDYRFAFRDLIVLRAARGLYASNVPSRRVLTSLHKLRARLPSSLPLSGLRVCVADGEVVVHDRGARWQAVSGQLLLDFEVWPRDDGVIVEGWRPPISEATEHFEQGCRLEDDAPDAACEHYRRAIACDETCVHAYINLGCLLHAQQRWEEAEAVYRSALETCAEHGILLFNLAVLLEDCGSIEAALDAYAEALDADPGLADAHFNLARLYAALGRSRDALRAYNEYRRLAGN